MKEEKIMHGDVEVREALRWIAGILDYSQVPFIVLGGLVEQMVKGELTNIEKIEIGVMKNAWSETTKSLVRTFLLETPFKGADLENGLKAESNGVPIEVKVITRNYEFFKNPDFAYYWADEYKIPNPWTKYMKARYLIR
jgi:hypothetical protein